MLEKPRNGWSLFKLTPNCPSYDLSYLTDVSFEWLAQAIHGLRTLDTFAVHGVCEPGRMICVVSYWNCYVIFEGENPDDTYERIHNAHISMIDFCKELHSDISRNLEAWVHWDDGSYDYDDPNDLEKMLDNRKSALLKRLDTLIKLIDKKSEHFGPHRCFF